MKQSYFTSPGFTFRLLPFGTPTALFLLFFLLNFSFGFGQDCTISSSALDPTDESPIPLNLNFEGPVNRDLTEDDFIVPNGEVGNFERGVPEYFLNSSMPLINFDLNVEPDEISLDFDALGSLLAERLAQSIISITELNDSHLLLLTFGDGVKELNKNGNITDDEFIDSSELNSPLDIEATDYTQTPNPQIVYIADKEDLMIKRFNNAGVNLTNWGSGELGDGENEFYGPTGLVSDDEYIYLADAYTGGADGLDLVKIYDHEGNLEYVLSEETGYNFFDPYRIAVDKQGRLYVADGESNADEDLGRIQVFEKNISNNRYELIHTIKGEEEDKLGAPGSIVIDEYGYLYVIDYEDDLTLSSIYESPEDLILNYDEIVSKKYSINVYDTNQESFNLVTSFNDGLNLPIDLEVGNCGEIYVNNLELSGPGLSPNWVQMILAPIFFPGQNVIETNFDFQLKTFTRHDNFTAEVTPEDEGEVVVTLNSDNDFFPCDPQPECSFSIDYETEAAPEPTVTCPSDTSLPELSLDANCDPILPTNWADIIETENFADENFSVIDENISDNILTVKVEVLDGSELIETCELHFELIDEIQPEITCPENITREIPAGEDSIVINYDLPQVSDNCSENLTPELIGGQASGTAFEEGVYTIEYEVTDDADLTSTCSFTIIVTQEEAQPGFTCPDNADLPELSLDQNCDYELPPFGDIIETENFDDLNFSVSENRVDNILNVELEVLDGSELIETCELQFELIDEIEPKIICPDDITREIPAGEDSISINYNLPEVSDNCSENLIPVLIEGQAAGSEFEEGVHTIEYEVTDDANFTVSCEFTITITKEEAQPSITCPDNAELPELSLDQNCDYELPPFGDIIETENFDDLNFSVSENRVDNTLNVEVEVLNGSELIETCKLQFELIDEIEPEIFCPDNITREISAGEDSIIINYDLPEVSDNCSENLIPELIDGLASGSEFEEGVHTIEYKVTDDANLSVTCIFTITVTQNNPNAPEITCPGPQTLDLNGNCEIAIPDYTGMADNPDGAIITQIPEPGTLVNQNQRIELTATLDGESSFCNFQLEVINTANDLSISCPYEDTHVIEIPASEDSTTFEFDNPVITGGCGDISLEQTEGPASGEVFSFGTTRVSFTATDEADNTVSCSFNVRVERETDADRVYRCIEEEDISDIRLDEDCELNIPEYTRLIETENFNAAITQTYEALTEDTYLITVEIRDDDTDEFVGDCEFSVNIVDLIPPGISCPNDQIENFDPDTGFEVPNYENMAGISDNCGEVSFRQEPAAGEIIYNNTTVNLFVEDEGGLEASCSFELELTEADVLNISCLLDKNVNPDDNCSFWLPDYTSNAEVNFPGADITQTPPVGTILTESTQIKLTASLNGETDECYFMVNLVDDQDPVANCVSGYVVNLGNNGTASITPEDLNNNSTDNCGIVSMALSQVDFTTADIGDVPITLTVRDDAGNIDYCETTVEVRDEASGEFECRENIEVFLDENGEANLNIQELYTGDASGLNLEASRLNFTCEDLGVAFIQLDYSGDETGSCTINVDVQDELPPEINTNLVELTLDNEGFAYLEESDISAEDNCSEELIYRSSKSVFTCKDVGMNSVNVEVEDINGNRSDKNIQVRISGEGCDLPEPGENAYLFLYPNPNNGIFTIATPEGMFIEQVRVFDSRGRYIMQQDYNANARFYRMTIQGVEESVYTLQIFTNEGVIVKRAIIKR